jgi:uncharacterized protein involved in exopolysaccharide biosynthesis
MDDFELKDYLSILRRRKNYFFGVFAAIFLCSVILAFRWSNYRSTATVEVAPSEISANTTRPTGMSASDFNESLADLRISHLQQKVMSTASLIEIITKFNLYPDARKVTPIAEIADRMLGKIKLELVSSTLASPSTAQKASADQLSAIAFTLSFDYSNPLISQQVANELVTRFLDEDLKDRRKSAHETSVFLDAQIKALETSIDDQEKKIADYKKANGGIEPQSLLFNQQAAESILLSIQSIDSQINTNEGTQGSLRAQIATVDPYTRVLADGQILTTPAIQLKALKAQYTTLSAQYGPDHPDVIKVRHQIAALEKQVGHSGPETPEIQSKITDVRANLAAARKTYGPDHPDVVALEHQLAALETKLADLEKNPSSENIIKQDADNPAYLQLVEELKSAEEQHKSLMKQKDALLAQQAKYQSQIAANPAVEQKLAALSRDYENSQLRYRELKEKKMAADMSETIEQDRSGQRLIIINPPELPIHTQPSRMLFIIGGLIMAAAGGLGSVAAAQFVSQSVVGARHLESLTGVAPLVTIPHIFTAAELENAGRKKLKIAGIAIAALFIAAIVFSYAVEPLDVLWAVLRQKFGLS